MEIIQGKIEWLPPKPTEYPEGSGDFKIGIKMKGAFHDLHKPIEKLEKLLKTLKVGYEIKISVEHGKVTRLEVISEKIEAKPKSTGAPRSGSLRDQLERVNYKTLMNKAHEIGLVQTRIEFVPELSDISKKTACFKATVTIKKEITVDNEKCVIVKIFEDFGDACGLAPDQGGNIDAENIRNAWVRMASTRAQVRALKQATNNMEVAEEELPDAKLPKE